MPDDPLFTDPLFGGDNPVPPPAAPSTPGKKYVRVKDTQTGKSYRIGYDGAPPNADEIDDVLYGARTGQSVVSPGMGDVKRIDSRDFGGRTPQTIPSRLPPPTIRNIPDKSPLQNISDFLTNLTQDRTNPLSQSVGESVRDLAAGVASRAYGPDAAAQIATLPMETEAGKLASLTGAEIPETGGSLALAAGGAKALGGIASAIAPGPLKPLAGLGGAVVGGVAAPLFGRPVTEAMVGGIGDLAFGKEGNAAIRAAQARRRAENPATALAANVLSQGAFFRPNPAGLVQAGKTILNPSKLPALVAAAKAGLPVAQAELANLGNMAASVGVGIAGGNTPTERIVGGLTGGLLTEPTFAGHAINTGVEGAAALPGTALSASRAYNSPLSSPVPDSLAIGTTRYTTEGKPQRIVAKTNLDQIIGHDTNGKPIPAKGAAKIPAVVIAGSPDPIPLSKFLATTTADIAPSTRIVRNKADLTQAFTEDWKLPPAQAKLVADRWHAYISSVAKQKGIPLSEAYKQISPGVGRGGDVMMRDILQEQGQTPEQIVSASETTAGVAAKNPDSDTRVAYALVNPDTSTAFHELGHIMREQLTPDELDAVAGAVGAKKDATGQWVFDEAAEEKFASAAESVGVRGARRSLANQSLDSNLPPAFAKVAQGFSAVADRIASARMARAGTRGVNPALATLIESKFGYKGDVPPEPMRKTPPGYRIALPDRSLPVQPFQQPRIGTTAPPAEQNTALPPSGNSRLPITAPAVRPRPIPIEAAAAQVTPPPPEPVKPPANQPTPAQPMKAATPPPLPKPPPVKPVKIQRTGPQAFVEDYLAWHEGSPATGGRGQVGPEPDGVAYGLAKRSVDVLKTSAVSTDAAYAMQQGTPSPNVTPAGKQVVVHTPQTNRAIPVRYRVVEADSLIPSHTDTFAPHPNYDPALQPRDRTRVATKAQVADIATRLSPARLTASPTTAEGAPIVGSDLQVESGNGRTLAIRKAYKEHFAAAAAYRAHLLATAHEYGVDPGEVARMKQPVLVRVREEEIPSGSRAILASEMGESPVASMSATENAQGDAKKLLSSGILSKFVPNDAGRIDTTANSDFKRAFLSLLSEGERANLMRPDGSLSADGERRMKGAILASAYGDPHLIGRILEGGDTNNLATALLRSAPKIAALREGISKGTLHSLDIAPDIADAANRFADLTKKPGSIAANVKAELAQTDMFATNNLSPAAKELLSFFGENANKPAQMANFLTTYADVVTAAGDPKQIDMFGSEKPTVDSALTATREIIERNANQQQAAKTLDLGVTTEPVARQAVDKSVPPGEKGYLTEPRFQIRQSKAVGKEGTLYADEGDVSLLRRFLPGKWRGAPLPGAHVSAEIKRIHQAITQGDISGADVPLAQILTAKLSKLSDSGARDIQVIDASGSAAQTKAARRGAQILNTTRDMMTPAVIEQAKASPYFSEATKGLPSWMSDRVKVAVAFAGGASGHPDFASEAHTNFAVDTLLKGYAEHGEAFLQASKKGATRINRSITEGIQESGTKERASSRQNRAGASHEGVLDTGAGADVRGHHEPGADVAEAGQAAGGSANAGGTTEVLRRAAREGAERRSGLLGKSEVEQSARRRVSELPSIVGAREWAKIPKATQEGMLWYASTQNADTAAKYNPSLSALEIKQAFASRGIAPPGKNPGTDKGSTLGAWVENTKVDPQSPDRIFWAESPYEVARAHALNNDPNVASFGRADKFTVTNPKTDQSYRYTPDFHITYKDGRSVYEEVKPREFVAKRADVLARVNAAKTYLTSKGDNSEVRFVTQAELAKDKFGAAAAAPETYRYMKPELALKMRERLKDAGRRGELQQQNARTENLDYLFQNKPNPLAKYNTPQPTNQPTTKTKTTRPAPNGTPLASLHSPGRVAVSGERSPATGTSGATSPISEQALSLYKAGLISSPRLLVRNIASHTLRAVSQEAAKIPAVGYDIVTGGGWRRPRASIAPDLSSVWRTLSGSDREVTLPGGVKVPNTRAMISELLRTGQVSNDPFDSHSMMQFGQSRETVFAKNPAGQAAALYANLIYRSHSATDRPYRMYAFYRTIDESASLIARAEARAGTIRPNEIQTRADSLRRRPTSEMVAEAIWQGEASVFQNKNVVSSFITSAKQGITDFNPQGLSGEQLKNLKRFTGAARIASDVAVPFSTVPPNVVINGVEGVLGAPAAVVRQALSRNISAKEQAGINAMFGKGAIGAGLLWAGMSMARHGLLTGLNVGPNSYRDRTRHGETEGSFYANGKYYRLKAGEPATIPILIGATLQNLHDKGEDEGSGLLDSMKHLLSTLPMVGPLVETENRYPKKGESPLMSAAGAIGKSLVPSAIRDAAKDYNVIKSGPKQGQSEGNLWNPTLPTPGKSPRRGRP